ncbi:MAG: hypothetical protein Fur0037_03380 [Planctomycetota bacterium]
MRSMRYAFGAILLATPLVAQTPNHLIGLTRTAPALMQYDQHNCQVLQRCHPVNFPNSIGLPPEAGGTAWDPVTRGAWITNGHMLAKVDDQCNYQCPPMLLPFPTANQVATGLEVAESMRSLFVIDNRGLLYQFTLTCQPVQVSVCQTGLSGSTFTTSGIAIDEGLGLVFISYVDFVSNVNWITVSPLSAPCQIMQRIQVMPCPVGTTPFGAITGLCVDWARGILYATDGTNSSAMHYVPSPTGGIQIVRSTCCSITMPNLDPLVGLAVWPGRETPFGQPCNNGSCPSCPSVFVLGNDPNLGNGAFYLELQQAPIGMATWAILGFGPCTPPGLLIRPLCGPLYTNIYLGSIGPVPTLGMWPCGGTAQFHLPLPVIPSLAGTVINATAVGLCTATITFGTTVSNCLSFELQGS